MARGAATALSTSLSPRALPVLPFPAVPEALPILTASTWAGQHPKTHETKPAPFSSPRNTTCGVTDDLSLGMALLLPMTHSRSCQQRPHVHAVMGAFYQLLHSGDGASAQTMAGREPPATVPVPPSCHMPLVPHCLGMPEVGWPGGCRKGCALRSPHGREGMLGPLPWSVGRDPWEQSWCWLEPRRWRQAASVFFVLGGFYPLHTRSLPAFVCSTKRGNKRYHLHH